MPRLFVALRPPRDLRSALLATMHGVSGARWQDDEQLHVTLRFIGEVPTGLAEEIAIRVDGLAGRAPTLAVDGMGSFNRRGRPTSLWARVPVTEELSALHRQVGGIARGVGLPPEPHAFTPHITVARLGRSAGPVDTWLADHAGLRIPQQTFSHVYLYESVLGRDGSTYLPVCRTALS